MTNTIFSTPKVYCDNAATTKVAPEVLEAILPYFTQFYGNPSSTHYLGKQAAQAIEVARKQVAFLLNASPNEIFFTSGATEANNLALSGSIEYYGVKHVISSHLEHSAVAKCLEYHQNKGTIEINYVKHDEYGRLDYKHLAELLRKNPRSLVSLMHANNEIGNVYDLEEISKLAKKYESIFHTDTVQTVGKKIIDLQKQPIAFLVGSAHKFHGIKGVGFIYVNKNLKINPIIFGGAQEKGLRSGTENVAGIVGLGKALSLAYEDLESTDRHLKRLKSQFINSLRQAIPEISFNGESESLKNSLLNIVNVSFPALKNNVSWIKMLETWGIAVSAGSACSSAHGSRVLHFLNRNLDRENVRFSFSKYNTLQEIDYIVDKLKKLYHSNISSGFQEITLAN